MPLTHNEALRIAIIIGSTRPGRKAEAVAKWVCDIASKRRDVKFELVDIQTFKLPLLDEPVPPSIATDYTQPHTKLWSAAIDRFDGFVFVTPEYNHGVPGALKNAIDFLYREWNNKAAAFVSYGSASGTRAVEQLRLVMGELQIADVRAQVMLSLAADFRDMAVFEPQPHQEKAVSTMLDQLLAWSTAMRSIRLQPELLHPQ